MMVNSSGKNFKIANGKMPLEMPVEFCHDDNMDENPKNTNKTYNTIYSMQGLFNIQTSSFKHYE